MNDPTKTIATSMFIIMSLQSVRIGDATSEGNDEPDSNIDANRRKSVNPMDIDGCGPIEINDGFQSSLPEGREPNDPPLSNDEINRLIRTGTSSFNDWIVEFFRRVFILFENLPEEGGKNNRVGGKTEESVINTVLASCEVVCAQMSPPIFTSALRQVFQYASTTTRANGVRVIGQLVACFARADPEKTLKQFFTWTSNSIKTEIKHGASSVRTTSTSIPFSSDTALHWSLAILVGCVTHAGTSLLNYKDDLIDLLKLIVDSCKSERGYVWVSQVVQRIFQTLTCNYVTSSRFVNSDEWNSPSFARNHINQWGKLYDSEQVKIDWHVPTNEEIDMTTDIVKQVLEPELKSFEGLLNSNSIGNKDWSNDFCRKSLILRHAFSGLANLFISKPKEEGVNISDYGEFPKEFVEKQKQLITSNIFNENDERLVYFDDFRERFGQILHESAGIFIKSQQVQESLGDSIDCIKSFLRSVRVFMIENGIDATQYDVARRKYSFAKSVNKVIPRQKEWPRLVYVRRAAYLQATRMHLNTFHRKRSKLDDLLLDDVLELSLSQYTAVRKTAQNTLVLLSSYYDGTKAMSMNKILESLKPGTDVDRMKGALFILMNKPWINYYIIQFKQFKDVILSLLGAQFEEKPSIQTLIQNLSREIISRMPEIASLTSRLNSNYVNDITNEIESTLNEKVIKSHDENLLKGVENYSQNRITTRDELYNEFVPLLLDIAESDKTHWRYQLLAQRVLKNLIRRDRPTFERVTRYFLKQTLSDHPKIRSHAYGSIMKILHFIKLRTFGKGPNLSELLLLRKTKNPLQKTIKLDEIKGFSTDNYLETFRKPINEWNENVLLQDKSQSGWLCWGPSIEVYSLPPVDRFPFEWEEESSESINAITETIMSIDWWYKICSQLSMESSSNIPSYEHVAFIKSIFAMSEKPLSLLKKAIEPLLEDAFDRHKQRAASELLSGLLRGSKHWPKYALDDMWSWLTPKLPHILGNVRPDSAATWEVFVETVLYHRDPRRMLPLINWILKQGNLFENASSSAWSQAFSISIMRTAIKTINWRFSKWSSEISPMYWNINALNHDYAEVRANIAKTLQILNRSQVSISLL